MNQFITRAVIEKVSTRLTVDSLKERAHRGDRKTFDRVYNNAFRFAYRSVLTGLNIFSLLLFGCPAAQTPNRYRAIHINSLKQCE